MPIPTEEELAVSIVKAANRAAKENLAATTDHILTPAEQQILEIGILSGTRATLAELMARGAIRKDDWG